MSIYAEESSCDRVIVDYRTRIKDRRSNLQFALVAVWSVAVVAVVCLMAL